MKNTVEILNKICQKYSFNTTISFWPTGYKCVKKEVLACDCHDNVERTSEDSSDAKNAAIPDNADSPSQRTRAKTGTRVSYKRQL